MKVSEKMVLSNLAIHNDFKKIDDLKLDFLTTHSRIMPVLKNLENQGKILCLGNSVKLS